MISELSELETNDLTSRLIPALLYGSGAGSESGAVVNEATAIVLVSRFR
jgi:hypothetical protein